jgi:SpoVK/Ycf46/Vps4 family AAA+-type ATPase
MTQIRTYLYNSDRGLSNDVVEMRRVLNSFLQFIEQDISDSIVIAATNNQELLDKALFRRFDDVLYYNNPTDAEKQQLIENVLGLFKPSITTNRIKLIKEINTKFFFHEIKYPS